MDDNMMDLTSYSNNPQIPLNNESIHLNTRHFVIIPCIVGAIEVYILIAFLCFLRKKKASQNNPQNRSRNKANLMFAFFVMMDICGILKNSVLVYGMANNVTFHNYTEQSDGYLVETSIYNISFVVGLTCLYSFLWLRQYTLYVEPNMRRLASQCMIRFSNSIIFLIFLFSLIMLSGLIFAFIANFKREDSRNESVDFSSAVLLVMMLGGSILAVIYQGSILFCFCYILKRHQAEMSHFLSQQSFTRRPTSNLHRVTKNCSIATGVSIATDLVTITVIFLLLVFMAENTTFSWYQLLMSLWEIDYVINLGCVIFCFSTWRKMLFPWRE